MKLRINTLIASGVLALALTGTAIAGPFEDSQAAIDRGDYAEAVRLLRPLAKQGKAIAQANLGVMYANGQGVPQDYVEAVVWLRKAAERGDADGQSDLGSMYANGQGVAQDYAQAHMWFNLAASRARGAATRDRASKYRDELAAKMTSAQIAEAQRMAREWKPTK